METPSFSIGRSGHAAPFHLIERRQPESENATSVRECLERHRRSLAERLVALGALLATCEPELAELALLDDARIRIDEVTLRPLLRERIERFAASLS